MAKLFKNISPDDFINKLNGQYRGLSDSDILKEVSWQDHRQNRKLLYGYKRKAAKVKIHEESTSSQPINLKVTRYQK
ncbi:hypothetical protein Anas_07109 [Armadillidium nasatum]|uniref:Uncharacterized protein n=1 Tax=Armadillidium nasatum TaxID=96803 RepID=A0A5N5SY90_9CRUS|nr:hypothetical protein Anas_07109 [Armadillidium nasatum]